MDRYTQALCGHLISYDEKSKELFKKLYEPHIKEAEKKGCEPAKKKQKEDKKSDKETVPRKKRKYRKQKLPEYI